MGQGGQRGGGELVLLALVTRLTGQDHSGQEAEHADHQLRLLVRPGEPVDIVSSSFRSRSVSSVVEERSARPRCCRRRAAVTRSPARPP